MEHVRRVLESLKSALKNLQEQLQEVRQHFELLADLDSNQSVEGTNAEVSVSAPVTQSASQPAPVIWSASQPQLPIAQPVQQAVRLSNCEQLVLAQQRALDWAARELSCNSNSSRNQSL
jgi:hypothetical protein